MILTNSLISKNCNSFDPFGKFMCRSRQECIPVGCVPSAAVAFCWWGRGCLPRGVSAGGVCLPKGVSAGGSVCLGGVCQGDG